MAILEKRVLKPYDPDLNPWTLAEAIQSDFLEPAIHWLATDGWSAGRSSGSYWEVAWSLIGCLNADKIVFVANQEITDEKLSIRKKIIASLEEMVTWLLSGQIQVGAAKGSWDDRLYDTAIVTRALLTFITWSKAQKKNKFPHTPSVIVSCQKGFSYLQSAFNNRVAEDITKSDALCELLQAITYAHYYLESEFIKALKTKGERDKHAFLLQVKEELLVKLIASAESDDPLAWDDLGSIVRALAALKELYTRIRKETLWDETIDGLVFDKTVNALEKRLPTIGSEGPTAVALGGYLVAHSYLSRTKNNFADRGIVLYILHKLLLRGNVFSDGSIFHNLYATQYLVYCLNQVCLWSEAQKPVLEVYADLLAEATDYGQRDEERVKIYRLSGELRRQEREYEKIKRSQAFYHIIPAIILAIGLTILGGLLGLAWGLKGDAFLTVIIFWIGILYTGTRAYANRVWKMHTINHRKANLNGN